ncbi:MAG: MGMT family protein [Candidatus Aureabacteria bacterium]|nr:MGMT family protein [Candidatus Auribacterota bacterium]
MKTSHSAVGQFCHYKTYPFGMVMIQWGLKPTIRIKKIELIPAMKRKTPKDSGIPPPAISAVFNAIQSEKLNKLSISLLDWSSLNPFTKKVFFTLSKIVPYGKVISYKGLAEKAGNRKAARAVGNVLAKNPFPLIIPCHRVICSSGLIGGFQGKKNSALLKKTLLASEGILFNKKGRVEKACLL